MSNCCFLISKESLNLSRITVLNITEQIQKSEDYTYDQSPKSHQDVLKNA